MPKLFPALFVLWAALLLPAQAAKVKFGDTAVTIPTPAGFTPNSEEELRQMQGSLADGALDSAKLAFFKKPDAATVGQNPPLRAAVVFSLIDSAAGGIDLETFAKLVASPGSKETMDALKAHLPQFAAPVIGGPAGSQDLRSLPSQISPPHVASDRHIALSMKLTGKTIGPGGVPTEHKTAYTVAFVLVRGMVIKLGVASESDGVAWTQETCRAWAEAVIAENPAEPGSAGAFSLDAPKEALDNLVAALPIDTIVAKARTLPWLGTLSPTALNSVLGAAALAILLFAFTMVLKVLRRFRA